MERTTVYFHEEHLDLVKELVEQRRFDSIANFMRTAVREKLERMGMLGKVY